MRNFLDTLRTQYQKAYQHEYALYFIAIALFMSIAMGNLLIYAYSHTTDFEEYIPEKSDIVFHTKLPRPFSKEIIHFIPFSSLLEETAFTMGKKHITYIVSQAHEAHFLLEHMSTKEVNIFFGNVSQESPTIIEKKGYTQYTFESFLYTCQHKKSILACSTKEEYSFFDMVFMPQEDISKKLLDLPKRSITIALFSLPEVLNNIFSEVLISLNENPTSVRVVAYPKKTSETSYKKRPIHIPLSSLPILYIQGEKLVENYALLQETIQQESAANHSIIEGRLQYFLRRYLGTDDILSIAPLFSLPYTFAILTDESQNMRPVFVFEGAEQKDISPLLDLLHQQRGIFTASTKTIHDNNIALEQVYDNKEVIRIESLPFGKDSIQKHIYPDMTIYIVHTTKYIGITFHEEDALTLINGSSLKIPFTQTLQGYERGYFSLSGIKLLGSFLPDPLALPSFFHTYEFLSYTSHSQENKRFFEIELHRDATLESK